MDSPDVDDVSSLVNHIIQVNAVSWIVWAWKDITSKTFLNCYRSIKIGEKFDPEHNMNRDPGIILLIKTMNVLNLEDL